MIKITTDLKKELSLLEGADVPVVKIGADLGASSVKVSYYKDDEIKDFNFPNRIDVDIENGDGRTIEVDGEAIKVASISGVSNANPKKANYRYLKHLMFNIAYELKQRLGIKGDIKLEINTCLPPKQFKESKDEYKENIKACSGVGTVSGEEFALTITDVKCGAEGVVLLKSFNLDTVAQGLMKIMLLDIGSSTTDIILLENMGSDRWKIKDADTSTAAGSSMCKDISSYLNKTTSANYSWDNLELLGRYQLNQEVKNIALEANNINPTVKSLLSDIDKVGTFAEYMPVLAGQGSKILAHNDLFRTTTKFFVVDDVNKSYGNSRGCLKA